MEDDGSVGSNISVNSSSSDGSDSRGPPPLVLHRYDAYSSDESSESGDEEEDFEVVREAVAQMSVQELLPVSGNEMAVSCRKCILCGELSHVNQDCPMEELNFDICLAMSDLNANDEEAPVIGACERPTAAVAATLPKVLRFESPKKAVTPSNMSSGREVSFMEPVEKLEGKFFDEVGEKHMDSANVVEPAN